MPYIVPDADTHIFDRVRRRAIRGCIPFGSAEAPYDRLRGRRLICKCRVRCCTGLTLSLRERMRRPQVRRGPGVEMRMT